MKTIDYDNPIEPTENYDRTKGRLNNSILIGMSDKGKGISHHIMPKLFQSLPLIQI